LRRLMTGRMLLKGNGLCVELRLAGVARLIGPDEKCIVVVNRVHTNTNRVCTYYIRVLSCIYHVSMEIVILEEISQSKRLLYKSDAFSYDPTILYRLGAVKIVFSD
jgi:hypothetical protein